MRDYLYSVSVFVLGMKLVSFLHPYVLLRQHPFIVPCSVYIAIHRVKLVCQNNDKIFSGSIPLQPPSFHDMLTIIRQRILKHMDVFMCI